MLPSVPPLFFLWGGVRREREKMLIVNINSSMTLHSSHLDQINWDLPIIKQVFPMGLNYWYLTFDLPS